MISMIIWAIAHHYANKANDDAMYSVEMFASGTMLVSPCDQIPSVQLQRRAAAGHGTWRPAPEPPILQRKRD